MKLKAQFSTQSFLPVDRSLRQIDLNQTDHKRKTNLFQQEKFMEGCDPFKGFDYKSRLKKKKL